MKLTVSCSGLEQIIQSQVKETEIAMRNRLTDMAFDILFQAQARIPIWTGTLEASGDVDITDEGDIVVGFAATPETDLRNPLTGTRASLYAWEVHEEGSPKHPEAAGYLTEAANNVLSNWQSYFADLPVTVAEDSVDQFTLEEGD